MMDESGNIMTPTELMIFAPVVQESEEIATVSNIPSNELQFSSVIQLHTKDEIPQTLDLRDVYVCEKCQRTFKQKVRYERHVANHPSEKHYLCTTCNKTFTRLSHLEKHTRTHSDERRHVCETCGAAFILPHHLVRHMLIHTGYRPFECEICHKQFTRKAGLTQHMHVHNGLRPYICHVDNCGRQFTDRTTLRRHILTHSREKPFICKECDKTFRTKSACRKHYFRHFKGDGYFKCGVCEEMFKTETELKGHNSIHESKQKIGIFRCGFCLRVFKSQEDLDLHVPLHQSGMKYKCSQCSIKFYTESDLVNHVSRHIDQTFTEDETNKVILPLETMERNDIISDLPKSDETSSSRIPSIQLQRPESRSQQEHPTTESGKVLVILQLPNNAYVKNLNGTLEFQSIQQLIGNAQVDKLLVTTDKVNDASAAFSLKLSQDQQQGIHQILRTTNLNLKECINEKASELSDSLFIHGSLPISNPTNRLSFHEIMPRKLGESVFTSPVRSVETVQTPARSLTSNFGATLNSSISHSVLKDYQLYEIREDYHSSKLAENVIATDASKSFERAFRDKPLETKTLFSGDFPLCENTMLGDDVSQFTIASTNQNM